MGNICFNNRSILLNTANGFNPSSTFASVKLHQRPGIQSAVVTMDTDINTSLRDLLVRTGIPNNREFKIYDADVDENVTSKYNIISFASYNVAEVS